MCIQDCRQIGPTLFVLIMHLVLQVLAAVFFIAIVHFFLKQKEDGAQSSAPSVKQTPADAAAAALASRLGISPTLPRRVLTLVARGTVLEANNAITADAIATVALLMQVRVRITFRTRRSQGAIVSSARPFLRQRC